MHRLRNPLSLLLLALFGAGLLLAGCGNESTNGAAGGEKKSGRDAGGLDAGGDRKSG